MPGEAKYNVGSKEEETGETSEAAQPHGAVIQSTTSLSSQIKQRP